LENEAMSSFFPRLSSALSYLGNSEPIYRWGIESAKCPLCGPAFFLSFAEDPFQVRCLKCRGTITNLAIAEAARQSLPNLRTTCAYEMSTYGSTFEFLKRNCLTLESSEYYPGAKPGELVNGIRNEDAQNLSFDDCSFELVTSNQVFEHVPDVVKCFQECKRILKPGGILLFTVPLYDAANTQHVATLEEGAIRWLCSPEYHASRVTGPNSVPVFWRFSVHDIVAKTKAGQFKHVALLPISICKIQKRPQLVVRAIK
jgi:SAM-dependent methyltransferase